MFFKSEAKGFSTGRPGPYLCQGRDSKTLTFPAGPGAFPTGSHPLSCFKPSFPDPPPRSLSAGSCSVLYPECDGEEGRKGRALPSVRSRASSILVVV